MKYGSMYMYLKLEETNKQFLFFKMLGKFKVWNFHSGSLQLTIFLWGYFLWIFWRIDHCAFLKQNRTDLAIKFLEFMFICFRTLSMLCMDKYILKKEIKNHPEKSQILSRISFFLIFFVHGRTTFFSKPTIGVNNFQ